MPRLTLSSGPSSHYGIDLPSLDDLNVAAVVAVHVPAFASDPFELELQRAKAGGKRCVADKKLFERKCDASKRWQDVRPFIRRDFPELLEPAEILFALADGWELSTPQYAVKQWPKIEEAYNRLRDLIFDRGKLIALAANGDAGILASGAGTKPINQAKVIRDRLYDVIIQHFAHQGPKAIVDALKGDPLVHEYCRITGKEFTRDTVSNARDSRDYKSGKRKRGKTRTGFPRKNSSK